ncbi:MAG: LysM peptidoglycan-binding domain-containing protein [Gemmatimonadaceae bacterium]
MIGLFQKASPTIATRSVVRAITLGAFLVLLTIGADRASAQVPTNPDTVRPVRTDTTNNLVMAGDTGQEVRHVVKKGDTLWDLAKAYLKDPFRWPEIFRRNTDVVENPHWIYPGEVIRIWGHEVRSDALARADSAGEIVSHVATSGFQQAPQAPAPTDGRSDLTVFASPMSRATAALQTADVLGRSRAGAVRRGEMQAAPYAERGGGPRDAGRLIASVDRPGIKTTIVQVRYQINDDLYLELPRGRVARLGDEYMSYVLGPDLGDNGQVVIPTGILRVENVPSGQRPIARIIKQFGEVRLDQRVVPAPDFSYPSGNTLSPVIGGTSGKVVYVHDEPVLPSIGHYLLISPNAKSGIQIGDEVTLVDNSVGRNDETSAPPVPAAVAQVVRVTPFAATAIIVRQTQPTIRDGMTVRLTGKMLTP